MRQSQADDFAQAEALAAFAQHIDASQKGCNIAASSASQGAYRIAERTAAGPRLVLQQLQAAQTDAAWRKVNCAQKTGVIARVFQEPQVGQRMFDFGPLKKAQTTVHLVRQPGAKQCGLDHPALRVAAVQHRNFVPRQAVAHQLAHLIHHPLGLGKVAGGLEHPHRLARALRSAQVFAQAAAVVADQLIGAVEDVAAAAVVFLQLDLVAHAELANKVGHIAHARAAKRVNALVVVAHRQHAAGRLEGGSAVHRAARAGAGAGQHLEPGVLQLVGVLKFVDQNVSKTPLVVLAYRVVVAQHLVAAQHQLTKIHHALALALLFIELVNRHLAPGLFVLQLNLMGAQAVFLAAANKPLHLLLRKALVVQRELLVQALDGGELVLRVENLKTLRQVGSFGMCAQKPVAQAVEGADPHAAHIERQHGREARHHLACGLVGEGHRQNPAGRDLPGLQQPGNARGQHTGFARARAGQNQRMLCRQGDGGALLGVEVGQQRGLAVLLCN